MRGKAIRTRKVRWLATLLGAFVLALSVMPVTAWAAGGAVYVSENGSDDNSGTDEQNAVKTLAKAVEIAGDGATIYVMDDLTMTAPARFWDKHLTITSGATGPVTVTRGETMAVANDKARWNYNSAMLEDAAGSCEMYHKSKLVVGTELTPYPKIFVPIDDWLSDMFRIPGLMGRCVGQDEVSLLNFRDSIPIGCAVCYESVYGDYCTEYVRKGAKALTVITNDAWWGDTPGYRQHLRFSCLRAIELRRDIARCGNTGISCFIDQRGDILALTPWWEEAVLSGELNLNSGQTFYVRNGDMIGGASTLVFILMVVLLIVRAFLPKR